MAPAISKPLLSDLVAQIGKVPSSHIRPVGDRPDLANVDNESGAGIPLIDLKKLNGPERPKVVEAIGRACESDGFFMVTNHGIPAGVVEGMLRVAREFFHLPESERLKCYSDDPKKAIRLSTSFNVRTEKVLELLPVDLMDLSLAADTKSQERGASWISAAISSGSALPRWLRKFKLGGSSSSSLLPVVAPSQQQPTHWESHSPGTRGFAAGAPRPSSQRRSSAAAESTSNSVSEILQGGSASGSFTPPPSLTSASSSPSRDTATRTPSPTTGKNAAADATDSGGEPPVGTRRSGSPPGPTDPPATAASSVATTTVNDDAMKVLIAMIAANSAINMALVVNMKDITSSWETQWEVLYAIFMMFSVLSTVTSIFTAVSPADSRARRFSSFCVRLGLLLATALFFVSITCQLGHSGCIAGVPTAAVLVIFLAVLWWKYC